MSYAKIIFVPFNTIQTKDVDGIFKYLTPQKPVNVSKAL